MIWQLAGSLAGVLALAGLAWLMRLGGSNPLAAEGARRLAEESHPFFKAEAAFVSTDGRSALVRGTDGEVLLLKCHGVHVASRLVRSPLRYANEGDVLIVDSGDRLFGPVRLKLSAQDRDMLLEMT